MRVATRTNHCFLSLLLPLFVWTSVIIVTAAVPSSSSSSSSNHPKFHPKAFTTIHSSSSSSSTMATSHPRSSVLVHDRLATDAMDAATGIHDDDDDEEEARHLLATRGGATTPSESSNSGLLQNLKIGFYFGLWYALNIVYNIVNKKVLNVLPAPLLVGSLQFGVGALYVALLWTFRLRQKPVLSNAQARTKVRTVGFWHCLGQLLSMVSLGAGPVSFTHIVKALEPFFSAIVAALYFGKWMHPVVYATLMPVVGGVGYACLKEKSFSWLAFNCAMGSNLAFALRAVLSKIAMTPDAKGDNPLGQHLSAPNMFGLVTCAAFWISIPVALATEGTAFFQSAGTTASPETLEQLALPSLWSTAVGSTEQGAKGLIQSIVISGLFHYLNNEVMYLALSNVHPVTLAVGNTMKRVIIMVASVMVFRNQISLQAGIGSAVGISGVLLYSLTKQYYENLEKQSNNKKGSIKKAVPKKKAAPARKTPGRK